MAEAPSRTRLDKWLWQARFFKTRSLAAKSVQGGGVRVDGDRVSKTATQVAPGQTLTFAQGNRIRVIRIRAIGTRRGPAPEAQALYEDLTPEKESVVQNPAFEGKGRPSKKDRRKIDLNRLPHLD